MMEVRNTQPREESEEPARRAMTPRQAVDILRNANLGGVLRTAADMGIEALEREMEGTK